MLKVLALLGLMTVCGYAYPTADLVTELEGQLDVSYGLYSGYVDVGTTKKLHYMTALSQNDPATDPVIVWFNGGPGCSSMLGWATEHGPYIVPDGTDKFIKNDYSWNIEATMIYIEAPAGVGYSICTDPESEECNFNDNNSADDNMVAFLAIMDKFPELQKNPLWISGESYAGVYVPQLVKRIDKYLVDNAGK